MLPVRGRARLRGVAGAAGRAARGRAPRPRAATSSALLDELGLRRHFDVVVTADDVCWGKPEPGGLPARGPAARRAAAGCLVFEDSLVGVQAARRAGMRVIGVTTAHTDASCSAAGAERAIADFEGFEWTVSPAVSAPDFWEGLYAAGHDGWELGGAAPALGLAGSWSVQLASAHRPPLAMRGSGPRVRRARAAAAGHDARFLAAPRLRVVGFDFSAAAVTAARRAGRARRRGRGVRAARHLHARRDAAQAPSTGCGSTRASAPSTPRRRDEYVRVLPRDPPAGRLAAGLLLPAARGQRRPALPGLAGRGATGALAGRVPRRARPAAAPLRRPPPGPRVARRGAPVLIAFVDRPCAGVLGLAHFSLAVRELEPQ